MKATGIVRRIDDLGRVVIPKEIRRVLRIRDGDPLEIYTAGDGEVIFKKYSPIGELTDLAVQYAEAMIKHTSRPVIICDRDHCIAAAGISKKDIIDRRISGEIEKLIESRNSYFEGSGSGEPPVCFGDSDRRASAVVPIISGGDISGAVILVKSDGSSLPTETDISLVKVAASFLGKQMEE